MYAWQSQADSAIIVGTLPHQRKLAEATGSPETIQMLGFVGDSLHYRAGTEGCELRFSS